MAFNNPLTLGRELTPPELVDNFEQAQALHDEALTARDQAVSAAGIFVSTAAGLAATTNGEHFCTPSVDSGKYLVLYRNNAGSALEVSTYPSKAAVDAAITAAGYTGLTEITANAGTDVLPVNDGAAKKTTLSKVLAWIRGQANTWSEKQTFSGFIVPGESAPAIKMKKLTGTTAGSTGGAAAVPHGVTNTKILSVAVLLEYSPGAFVNPGWNYTSGYEYHAQIQGANLIIQTKSGNDVSILSKSFKALITYEE